MRWIGLLVTFVILLAIAAALWLKIIYGTLDPCEALTAELQREAARRAGIPAHMTESPRQSNINPAQAQAKVEGLSTSECAGRLFSELLSGAPAPKM